MNRIITTIFLLFMLSGMGRLYAQSTITADVFAEIIIALTAQETEPLSFGRFSPESTGGSIIISPDGLRLSQGDVIPTGVEHGPARFFVTGHLKAQFEVILPEGPVYIFREGGSESMRVTNFTLDNQEGIWVLEDGTHVVNLGATLEVGSMETNPTGLYSGSYSIIFLYY